MRLLVCRTAHTNPRIHSMPVSAPQQPSEAPPASTTTIQGSAGSIRTAAILVTTLFFFWGIVNNLLPAVVAKVRDACDLTTLQASFLASAFWAAYFIMPIPAAVVMRRYGYKGAIVVGLFLGAVGCGLFVTAASYVSYMVFLIAPFVAASGMAFLESAANPYISVLGTPEKAPNRLNFAQAFNGVAAFVSALWLSKLILGKAKYSDSELKALNPAYYEGVDAKLGTEQLTTLKHSVPAYIDALAENARSVIPVFLVIAVAFVVMAAIFIMTRMPDTREHEAGHSEMEEEKGLLSRLFSNKYFLFGVFAQFCYVGAQVGVDDFFLLYVPEVTGLPKGDSVTYLGLILGCFMLGRVVGTSLMTRITARKLLAAFAIANIILLAYCGFAPKYVAPTHSYDLPEWLGLGKHLVLTTHPAPYVLMGVKFFMSIMFPTIFSLALTNLGKATKTGAMLLVMSIVGGAIFSPVMGLVADKSHMAYSYLIPMICMLAVLGFAMAKPPVRQTAAI